jgi:hypothetical protein
MARHHAHHARAGRIALRQDRQEAVALPFSVLDEGLRAAVAHQSVHLHVKVRKRRRVLRSAPLFHLGIAVEFVPGRKDESPNATRLGDGVGSGDGRGHCNRDHNGTLHVEVIKQSGEVQHLAAQRVAVRRQLALAVPAPVIHEAPELGGEVRDDVLEHFDAVVLAVQEHDVRSGAGKLVIKIAVVDSRAGHGSVEQC